MLKTPLKLNNVRFIKQIAQKYSTKPAVKEKTNYEDQLKDFEKISNVSQKIRFKNPQKLPFVKNLLLGIVDTDLLAYPELSNEELSALENSIQQAKVFLERPEVKENKEVSGSFLTKLAQQKLLGLQTSQLMGGRDLNATELCRFFEIISEINLKHNIINNENLGIRTLLRFGSDKLKKKYLQRLINGESISAFCCVEPFSSNTGFLKKTAVLSSDGKTWILNGEKRKVVNGSNADLYVVMACTKLTGLAEEKVSKYSAFVVERDFGGVTSYKHNTVDDNLQVSDLTFQNTPIPSDNLIGEEDKGENILSEIYPEHRLSTGPVCSVLTRNLIDNMVKHFTEISKEPYFLYETDAVQSKMGELTASLYAIDSMIYLTAGLIDKYENQDTELETAIVKVFASEQTLLNTIKCLDLVGIDACTENHWCNKLHREAICQVSLNDSNENLKTLIALFGLQYAGKETKELIKKLRNPLFYVTFILKRMWIQRKQAQDNVKLNLFLHHYLHPSCITASQRLEYCILRLQFATETFLSRYGQEAVNKHVDLRRLAECIIDIYAMFAVISRASRSYCIGLQHSEYEMVLANAFSLDAWERVKEKLSKVIDGPYQTNDENDRFVSERLFRFKQYYPVHPLTRNF